MQTYPPQPVPITDVTVELPQDVIDDVVVGTVNPTLQQLADAALYNQQARIFLADIVPDEYSDNDFLVIRRKDSSPASAWPSSPSDSISLPYSGYYVVSVSIPWVDTGATPNFPRIGVVSGMVWVRTIHGSSLYGSGFVDGVFTGTVGFFSNAGAFRLQLRTTPPLDIPSVGSEYTVTVQYLGTSAP